MRSFYKLHSGCFLSSGLGSRALTGCAVVRTPLRLFSISAPGHSPCGKTQKSATAQYTMQQQSHVLAKGSHTNSHGFKECSAQLLISCWLSYACPIRFHCATQRQNDSTHHSHLSIPRGHALACHLPPKGVTPRYLPPRMPAPAARSDGTALSAAYWCARLGAARCKMCSPRAPLSRYRREPSWHPYWKNHREMQTTTHCHCKAKPVTAFDTAAYARCAAGWACYTGYSTLPLGFPKHLVCVAGPVCDRATAGHAARLLGSLYGLFGI